MRYEGHKDTVHSNVSHHLQPYNGRLLGLYIVGIFTNATYDVSQSTYNSGFVLSVKKEAVNVPGFEQETCFFLDCRTCAYCAVIFIRSFLFQVVYLSASMPV